jgi:hypothetical protein
MQEIGKSTRKSDNNDAEVMVRRFMIDVALPAGRLERVSGLQLQPSH